MLAAIFLAGLSLSFAATDPSGFSAQAHTESGSLLYQLTCQNPCVVIIMTPQPSPSNSYLWQAYACDNPGGPSSGNVDRDSQTRIGTDCYDNTKYIIKPLQPWEDVDTCNDIQITPKSC